MGNKISEKSIVRSSMKWLKTLPNCKARKRRGGITNRGEPDIYGSIDGKHFEIEVKAPGGIVTDHQRARLEEWKATNSIVGVSYSLEDTKNIMKGIKND